MSAKEQMAQMLDELMAFDDDDVCKHFLVGYCPHELFINTKADLGPCTKMHDERVKEQYRQSSRFGRLGYEESFESLLSRLHNDMQRKIKRNNDRLALTQSDGVAGLDGANAEHLDDRLKQLSDKISEHLALAEELGAKGAVAESQEAAFVADRYRVELEQAKRPTMGAPDEAKPMEVCPICGCFLIVGDAQQRLDEHMVGKQHIGFAKIKATLEELNRRKEVSAKQREERPKREARDDDDDERKRARAGRERDDRRSSRRTSERDRHEDARTKSWSHGHRQHDSSGRRRSRSRDRRRDESERRRDERHRGGERSRRRGDDDAAAALNGGEKESGKR